MNLPIVASVVTGCLMIGSLTGAAGKLADDKIYNDFLENPDNYHLVDDLGRPVSQESKHSY